MTTLDHPTSEVPDVPGALVGWRAWVIGRSDALEPELLSTVQRTSWDAGRATVAVCLDHDHDAPATGCGCGLYGVVEPGRMMGVRADRGIIGCTALWGEVVEGTNGWRASHGYPRLLIADPGVGGRALARLRERYGVPVHVSEIPLPDLVTLLDTVMRDQADGLRDGTVEWPDLAPEIRRHAALLEAERARIDAESAARRAEADRHRERQHAYGDAAKVVGLLVLVALTTLLIVQGWQPWSWGLVVVPVVCWAAAITARSPSTPPR